MADLENENKMLKFQVDKQKRQMEEQSIIIDTLKAANHPKRKNDAAIQTIGDNSSYQAAEMITDRKADLLVEIESLKRRLSKMEKRIVYHKNKENKFLFFLFTL
jgi:hypothetical protein